MSGLQSLQNEWIINIIPQSLIERVCAVVTHKISEVLWVGRGAFPENLLISRVEMYNRVFAENNRKL